MSVRSCLSRIFQSLFVLVVCSATQAEMPPGDATTSRHVQDALRRDYRLRDSDIHVKTLAGVTTLEGTVATYLDKHSAERITRRTIGVRAVVNRIIAEATTKADSGIRADLERQFSRSRMLELPDVTVTVDRGVVTLSGRVDTGAKGQRAERIARQIRGVRSIKNDLRVMPQSTEVPDDALRMDVDAMFDRDAHLAGYPIEIEVESGAVTLTGDVPNLFLKQRAVNQTLSVPGVLKVHDQMVTDHQLLRESLPRLYTDAEIVQLVDRELTADPRIGINGIETRVMHGDVVLGGWVDSLFAKRLAGRITRQVLGVTNVRNELEVRAGTHSDQSVRLELLDTLKSDPLLANTEIAVAVLDGAVTLSGRVSAHPQRFRATTLTSRVSGVRQIANELQVSLAQERGDDSIRDDIVKRLDSNAITGEIAEQVGVSVEGGVVTLSGKVERYVVVLEALRIASRTDGVRKVENRLKVTRQ